MEDQSKTPAPEKLGEVHTSKKEIKQSYSALSSAIKKWFNALMDLETGLDREGTIIAIRNGKKMVGANAWLESAAAKTTAPTQVPRLQALAAAWSKAPYAYGDVKGAASPCIQPMRLVQLVAASSSNRVVGVRVAGGLLLARRMPAEAV